MTPIDSEPSQESLEHIFLPGMTIHNVAFYVNPSSVHLFLSPDPLHYSPCSILAITAEEDGTLHVRLQGPDVAEGPNDTPPD